MSQNFTVRVSERRVSGQKKIQGLNSSLFRVKGHCCKSNIAIFKGLVTLQSASLIIIDRLNLLISIFVINQKI